MSNDYSIRFIEESLLAPILMTLYQHEGEMMKTVVMSMLTTSLSRTTERFDKLESLGLVTIKKTNMRGSGHWVSLTEKGKQIAEHLIAIEKILSD